MASAVSVFALIFFWMSLEGSQTFSIGDIIDNNLAPLQDSYTYRELEEKYKKYFNDLILSMLKDCQELSNDLRDHINFEKVFTAKRSQFEHNSNNGQCNCPAVFKVRQLGREFYPRHVPYVQCEKKTCFNASQTCQPQWHKAEVLRLRKHTDFVDNLLPNALRKDWAVEEIPLPMGCECVAHQ